MGDELYVRWALVRQSPDRNVMFLQHVDEAENTAEAAKKDLEISKLKAKLHGQEIEGESAQSTKGGRSDDDGKPGENQMARSLEFHITLL